mmetsp:Transcript_110639/g.263753  ORF Transcript_110639/g.263753 Transcript_110639/m.263753 type:complete len:276 (-) Transcript_110639:60-887(-)
MGIVRPNDDLQVLVIETEELARMRPQSKNRRHHVLVTSIPARPRPGRLQALLRVVLVSSNHALQILFHVELVELRTSPELLRSQYDTSARAVRRRHLPPGLATRVGLELPLQLCQNIWPPVWLLRRIQSTAKLLPKVLPIIEIEEVENLVFGLLFAVAVHPEDIGSIRGRAFTHPLHQLVERAVFPHPIWKASGVWKHIALLPVHVLVHVPHESPITFAQDDVESPGLHQILGNLSPDLVKLLRSMRALAQKHGGGCLWDGRPGQLGTIFEGARA